MYLYDLSGAYTVLYMYNIYIWTHFVFFWHLKWNFEICHQLKLPLLDPKNFEYTTSDYPFTLTCIVLFLLPMEFQISRRGGLPWVADQLAKKKKRLHSLQYLERKYLTFNRQKARVFLYKTYRAYSINILVKENCLWRIFA